MDQILRRSPDQQDYVQIERAKFVEMNLTVVVLMYIVVVDYYCLRLCTSFMAYSIIR